MADLNEVLIDLSENQITPEAIRRFYKELEEINYTVKEYRAALKEALDSNEEIEQIDSEIKSLRERKKELLETNTVLVGYKSQLDDAIKDRKDLIKDAKRDGIPRKEIREAERMLKSDIDPSVTSEIYTNIADLVD